MNDVNVLLNDSYKVLNDAEFTNLVQETIIMFGGATDDLNALYEELKSNYGFVLYKFYTLIDHVFNNLDNMDISNLKVNPFLDLLVSLKNTKLNYGNKLLEKLNYLDLVKQEYSKISDSIYSNKKLSEEQLNVVKSASLLEFNNTDLAEQIIVNRIKGSTVVDYDTFCLSLITFTRNELKKFGIDDYNILMPHQETFQKTKIDNCIGLHRDQVIAINEDIVKFFYYNNNPHVIETIYHEIRHAFQNKMISKDNKFFNQYQIDMIREFIITNNNQNYYNENYKKIFYEQDAVFFAKESFRQFVESHGMTFNEESKKEYNNFIEKNNPGNYTTKRIVNGNELDLTAIFDEIIKLHPEQLELYPKLKYLYKVEDGMVIPKAQEELLNDYYVLMQDNNLTEEEKKKLEYSYSLFLTSLNLDETSPSRTGNGFIDVIILFLIVTITCCLGVFIGYILI